MKLYMIRRNPSTGQWVIYVRTAIRLHWSNGVGSDRIETPVYKIWGTSTTMLQAVQGLDRWAV